MRSEAARTFLASIAGSGRAARAAKALLARDGDPPAEEHAARVRRAECWLR